MRLNDDVHVLELPVVLGGQFFSVSLCLVVDAAMGAMLVDAGGPGSEAAIIDMLAEARVGMGDLRHIILTHQDLDHVGSLHALARASGARVMAHEAEAPFIDGSQQPRFAQPEVLERGPEFRPVVESLRPTPVDQLLTDGERLDLAGGVRVVSTPGHTPGHLCLYLERSRTLIAGDALLAHRGRVYGPSSEFSADLPAARESVRKLADLDVRAIVCYHGGVVDDDANGQLQRLAAAGGWSPA
jgi:glyoxylase-like metal-dependent hydrolase (beta-lactamase superfamily II)